MTKHILFAHNATRFAVWKQRTSLWATRFFMFLPLQYSAHENDRNATQFFDRYLQRKTPRSCEITFLCSPHFNFWQYGLDDRGSIPCRSREFFLRHCVQTSYAAQPIFYPMGNEDSSLGVKWPGREADHSPSLVPRLQMVDGAIPPLSHTSSWCGTWLSTGTTLPLSYK